MHASKLSSSTTYRHLLGEPATPTARHPLILASWPTIDPTAPDAAETTTVSPGFGWPMSSRPTYAVKPGMPRTPIAVEIGTSRASSLRRSLGFDAAYCCHPSYPATMSPARKSVCRDSTTSLTVCPHMTSPRFTDAAYDGPSLMRPRM